MLKAIREYTSHYNQQTIYKDKEGKVKHIELSKYQTKIGTPTITIKGVIYEVDWSETLTKKQFFCYR